VSHDGLYDLLAAIYSSDFVGGTLQEFKGTPWQNPQALIEQAPVTYARNFRTPMLIIHGGNDYRVDPSQGLSMFQVLQAKHVPSKLLYFEAENHWVLKPADSVLWYHTVLDWIDQWVKPDRAEFSGCSRRRRPPGRSRVEAGKATHVQGVRQRHRKLRGIEMITTNLVDNFVGFAVIHHAHLDNDRTRLPFIERV
jgi:hypothetical protein